METKLRVAVGVVVVAFLVFLMLTIGYASWTVYLSAKALVAAAADLPAADAVPLYINLYSAIVKDGLAPLLDTLLIAFVAFVTGKTVSVVSFNAAKARNPDSEPRVL